MSEILLLSLVTGCSGLQATIAALWLYLTDADSDKATAVEEETLTPYDSNETIDSNEIRRANKRERDPRLVGWEFKILRAEQDLFREPAKLQAACDEEALAGWILLEKLDDRRLRFKRPIAMREVINPETLGFDPYRSVYGPSHRWKQRLLVLIGVLALLLPAYVSFSLITQGNRTPLSQPSRTRQR